MAITVTVCQSNGHLLQLDNLTSVQHFFFFFVVFWIQPRDNALKYFMQLIFFFFMILVLSTLLHIVCSILGHNELAHFNFLVGLAHARCGEVMATQE